MIVFRKRLLFWLARAYIQKHGKAIIFFFLVGIGGFFLLRLFFSTFSNKLPLQQKATIGIVGAYRVTSLPPVIIADLSRGLTTLGEHDIPQPAVATSWNISSDGRTYTFHLNDKLSYDDGAKLTAETVAYNFSDVKVARPDTKTIVYTLKEPYAPFLVTVSRPLFHNGLHGILGPYSVGSVKVNGDFVENITLRSIANPLQTKTYQFYPTNISAKTAYLLGEVTTILNMQTTMIDNHDLSKFPNTSVNKEINYTQLATLFYNNQDSVLSDKRVRNALTYGLPDTFSQGTRALSPIAPDSWAYSAEDIERKQDMVHAKQLLKSANATNSATLFVEVKTMAKYETAAKEIAHEWRLIGVATKITLVDTFPTNYQIYLGDFSLTRDPDQYSLWHSDQLNNVTGYKNLRIDKLLEDGRKTYNLEERKKLYADFQKYLLEDSPAAFLFFPHDYTITRR